VSVVETERRGALTVLTLNRPETHNALNAEMVAVLVAAVEDAAADPAVRAVVLTGAGEKAFSAGADLKELAGMTAGQAHAALAAGQRAFRAVELAPVPVVAAVNGLALGGGLELALAATFPVLSTRASLGLPEAGLGLLPGYGGTQRLPRAVGPRVAAHLMLTGSRLSAERAYALGLSPLPPVEPADLLLAALEVAEQIAAQGPIAVRAVLAALELGRDAPLDAGLAVEAGLAALAVAGEESAEGIGAFLERRPARFADPEVGR
jgi:enoyl-CoA hydratase